MRRIYAALLVLAGCSGSEEPGEDLSKLPRGVPFAITRRDPLTALPAQEITAATDKLKNFWRSSDFFPWLLRVSHGVHASTGKPDFAVFWHDVDAVKDGDLVTFRHGDSGGGHNVYIPTSRLLASAAAGYLATGREEFGAIVEQYSKGIGAACRGLVHDANDPAPFLMARNVVAQNHEYTTDQGKRKAIDFTGWYNDYQAWNAHRFEYRENPYWGDVWVTNMRSKDDVPHIYFADIFLRYVIQDAADEKVREGAKQGDDCVRGFAKDIVDSGWKIRTKDAAGMPFVPEEDLASFVQYEGLSPNGECSAKIASAFLGTGTAQGQNCGLVYRNEYEAFAVARHYYNYHIVQTFHLTAILSALIHRQNDTAKALLNGMALRLDAYGDPASDEPGQSDARWNAHLAQLLLLAGASGVPLTEKEARLIQSEYSTAADAYAAWPRWDIWSAADDTYSHRDGYIPSDQGRLVELEAMGFPLIYCASPFKAAGAEPFDCAALIADPL